MGTEIKVWHVGKSGVQAIESTHPTTEADLEKWITESPEILGDDLLLIGQQKTLTGVGRFDLLALDSDGRIVVIELKRGISAREAVAQALDYASWLDTSTEEEIREIANAYLKNKKKDLDQAYIDEFDYELGRIDPQDHRILIVGASLDSSTERIINYLAERHSIDINAILFTHCQLPSGESVLARTVLVPEKQRQKRRSLEPTDEEIYKLAESRGVTQILEQCRVLGKLENIREQRTPGAGGASYRYWRRCNDDREKVVYGIAVLADRYQTPPGELDVWLRTQNLSQVTAITDDEIKNALKQSLDCSVRSSKKILVRLKNVSEAKVFTKLLGGWLNTPKEMSAQAGTDT